MHVPVWPVWTAALACEILCKPFGMRPPLFRRRVGFFTHNRAFDLSKARKHLGYVSQWKLKEGVLETVKWYKSMSRPKDDRPGQVDQGTDRELTHSLP